MENQLKSLKSASVISVLTLFFQSGYAAVLGLVANLVLTILLSPAIFGMYITMLSLISFLNYFSDIGLAASLIQKKEITHEDVRTTFTTQQILILALISIGFIASPVVKNFYHLPPEGVYLFWALLFSFFISSLKTIPSIFLERKIQFQKIVLVQVAESTVFYLTVIILAILHFGLWSFTIGVLLRAVTGLILIYSISFWRPSIGISGPALKGLLSFGIPFQSSSFLALFKDDLIILFLGKILGFAGVGYIGWAKKWAEAPLRIVMDNVSRVTFPLIARFQDNKQHIGKLVEKVLYYQTAILSPVMFGSLLIMPYIVQILPKYQKWAVALPLFYIFVISSFLVSYMAPFINLFNALGKVKFSFSFMLLWTVMTWLLTPLLTKTYGLYGFPITHLTVSITFFIVVIQARKLVDFDFFGAIYQFIAAAAVMLSVTYVFQTFSKMPALVNLSLTIPLAALIYSGVLKLFFNINIIYEVKDFLAKRNY